MNSSKSFAPTAMVGALMLACGTFYAAPAAAADGYARTFYQNAGGNCKGVTAVDESRLTRTEQRLINTSGFPIDLVCNLTTDYNGNFAANDGVLTQVTLWARSNTGDGSATISCIMKDGFYNAPGSGTYQPTGGNPVALAASGHQAAITWKAINHGGDLAAFRFLSPANIRCTLSDKTEVNDWMVEYNDYTAPMFTLPGQWQKK